jgi:hypothetical protein
MTLGLVVQALTLYAFAFISYAESPTSIVVIGTGIRIISGIVPILSLTREYNSS